MLDSYYRSVVTAIKYGDLNELKTNYILADPGDINLSSRYGCGTASRSLFNFAVQQGNPDIVSFLIDQGVDVNDEERYGGLPIMEAIENGNLEMVQLLVERGANLRLKNALGMTPQQYAKALKQDEIVDWLSQVSSQPTKYQGDIENKVSALSDEELKTFPKSRPDLMKQIQQLDLFARVVEQLPYQKQKTFYNAVSRDISPEQRETIQNIIRNTREGMA